MRSLCDANRNIFLVCICGNLGILDFLDSRKMTDAGPVDELDVESDEDVLETYACCVPPSSSWSVTEMGILINKNVWRVCWAFGWQGGQEERAAGGGQG